MSGNAGFNVTGQGLSGDNVLGYLITDFQAQTTTIINETKLAAALPSRMSYPIFREKGQGDWNDDGIYSRVDPVVYADRLHALAPPGCWLYGGNEFGSGDLAKQDDWTNRFVERCAALHRKPLVHNQAVLNPVSGITGWRQLRSSTRAAIDAGGGVGPHGYWRVDPASERKRVGRNAFSSFDELRQIHGEALTIIASEFAFDANLNGTGYVGLLDDVVYADQLIQASEMAWEYRAFVQFYGFFPEGSQWANFNLWFNEKIKPLIAAWNRSQSMTQPSQLAAPTTGGFQAALDAIPAKEINVRDQPNGNDVGDLLVGDTVTYFAPTAQSSGWAYVVPLTSVPRGAGQQPAAPGWVSLQGGTVKFLQALLPPTQTDTPNADILAQLDIIDAASARLRALVKS